MSNPRPSWNNYFKEIVKVTASRSSCKRLQVGCLFVHNNRIVAQGYNGFLPGCPHESKMREGHEQATIHAEQNAISDCANRGVSTKNITVYITHYPCLNCMKSLCAAGVSKIYYIDNYNNDELVKYFSEIANVPINKI